MARMIRTFSDDNKTCHIAPRKLPEGLQCLCIAKPDSVVVNGISMPLEAARLLREALSVAIVISEGMRQ